MTHRLPQHRKLNGLAHELRVLDGRQGDLANERAPLRQDLEQAGLGELNECLAHRRATGVKLLRHSLLRQGLPGPESQGDDGVAQRGIDLDACR